MDVLANGLKANFWIPVEEEPDIDRFIDEQIMIDMDRFMLVGTLEKVSTCKKKNEEKEYEYFKQITVQICNICLASDNNINIQIPAKKDEFLYDVKFRYAPDPEQDQTGDDMEEVQASAEQTAAEAEEKASNAALDFVGVAEKADSAREVADKAGAEKVDDGAGKEILQEAVDEISRDDQKGTKIETLEGSTEGKPLVEVLNETPEPELNDADIDEPDPAQEKKPNPNTDPDDPDLDEDSIDWGE